MYRNMLRVQDEYLAKAQALPRNTTATGTVDIVFDYMPR